MLDITLLAVGRIKEKSYQDIIADYEKRLRPYIRLKVAELAATPFSANDRAAAQEKEGRRVLDYLEKNFKNSVPTVYLLAERGRSFTSPELAAWLDKSQSLVLILGGALGFSRELYGRYPQLSLSPLTFPHELARVVLLEQLYRVATIINKKSYHY